MEKLNKSVIPIIESVYESLTASEKTIADFFIGNSNEEEDFSGNKISEKLHVSEASLTRFSKKCGYSGYREFIYSYKSNMIEDSNNYQKTTRKVLSNYEEILNKTYSLIDEKQIDRVIESILNSKNVYFYGIGSSGLVAQEMKSRFMRVGLQCDAFTDPDLMKISSALLDEDSVIIALSVSSDTPVISSTLKLGYQNGAKTVLLTANRKNNWNSFCDEVISIATSKNLDYGNKISPQMPLLLMIDIIYSYFIKSNYTSRKEIFSSTLQVLNENINSLEHGLYE